MLRVMLLVIAFATVNAFSLCLWSCETPTLETDSNVEISGNQDDIFLNGAKTQRLLDIMTDIRIGIFSVLGLIALVLFAVISKWLYNKFTKYQNTQIYNRAMSIIYRERSNKPPTEKPKTDNTV